MRIIQLTTMEIIELAEAATRADAEGKAFRLACDGGGIKYKVGGGMWSAPIGWQE